MKLINKNINVITMKYPSSWHKALWREGLVSGNGKIGANVYGGTKRESVLINHSALWTGTECNPLPDISKSLTKTRQQWITEISIRQIDFNKCAYRKRI